MLFVCSVVMEFSFHDLCVLGIYDSYEIGFIWFVVIILRLPDYIMSYPYLLYLYACMTVCVELDLATSGSKFFLLKFND